MCVCQSDEAVIYEFKVFRNWTLRTNFTYQHSMNIVSTTDNFKNNFLKYSRVPNIHPCALIVFEKKCHPVRPF